MVGILHRMSLPDIICGDRLPKTINLLTLLLPPKFSTSPFQNGLEQFTQVGQFEGHLPSPSEINSVPLGFDEDFYLNQHLGVKDAVEKGLFNSGFEHYIEIGQFEQRQIAAYLFSGDYKLLSS